MSQIDWKKVIGIAAAAVGTAFVATSIVAKVKKDNSVYKNQPEQKNPMEGKKVVFVEDENDKENADGKKGHLEAVGDAVHTPSFYEKYVKRACDVVLSFGGLVVLSPLLLGISIAIKIDDPGPVLFTQKRVGENKRYFKLHKFRSMKMSTPHDKPTHMLENPDQYITKVGKFIRVHSLDELPQIWDIFIGNMSVIGPRPALWNQDYLTSERDKYGANDIKPGLTGWAQINGRDELEIEDKARLDGEYCKNVSIGMDAKVFLGSLHVFGKDDSVVEGGTGEMKKEMAASTQEDLVSIIMPSYNTAAFVHKTIQSVLNQTYKNWELIIVDDCSTDNSEEVITAIADSKIKFFKNEKNSGAAASRNKALREATGKWIAFLDSDDLWLPEKLEKQIVFMKKNGYHFSYTNYVEIDEDNIPNGTFVTGPKKVSRFKMYTFNYMGCLTVMYDREFVGLIQIENLKKRNDYALWVKVVKKCPAFLLNETLAQYRIRSSGSVMNRSRGPLDRMKYSYYLWKDGEHLNTASSMFLTVVNFGFGVFKTVKYKQKCTPIMTTASNSTFDDDLAMVVVSCDAYMDVVEHFFKLKDRFMSWWDMPCYLVNDNAAYQHKGVTVINCGNDLDWSGRLRYALDKIPEKYILYFQEDYLIGKSVDKDVFADAYSYMRSNGLWYYKIDNLPKINKQVPGAPHLSLIPSNKRYGINLLTAIFDKNEFLARIPKDDVNAGIVETNFLNSVTDFYEYDLPGCVLDKRQIIDVHYGVRRGKWWPSTVRYFKKIGYIIDTEKRGINSRKKVFIMDSMSVAHHLMPTWMVRKTKAVLKKVKISFYSND